MREIIFPREIEAVQCTPAQISPKDCIGILMVNEFGVRILTFLKAQNLSDTLDIKKIVWLLYPEHNFPNMLLFQEHGLRVTDFFQGKRLGYNRFYHTLLNALDQIIEYLRFKNCAPKEAEIFQI